MSEDPASPQGVIGRAFLEGWPTNAQEVVVLNTIRKSASLPTLPAVALEIVRLSQDPRVSIDRVAEAIEKDPALAAKTLRFANSSYYAASRPIVSLQQALVRVGLRAAKMLALSFGLVGAMTSRSGCDFDFAAFWYRSLVTSIVARRIAASSVRNLIDHAFVAALLADVGCPILASAFPQQYRAVGQMYPSSPKRLDEIEQALVGIGHPQVGQMMLEMWQLPPELVEAVAVHHDVSVLPRNSAAFPVAAVVMTAGELSDAVIRGVSPQRTARLASLFRELFSFTAQHMGLILGKVEPELQQARELLEVPLPPVEELQTEAKSEVLRLALCQAAEQSAPATAK